MYRREDVLIYLTARRATEAALLIYEKERALMQNYQTSINAAEKLQEKFDDECELVMEQLALSPVNDAYLEETLDALREEELMWIQYREDLVGASEIQQEIINKAYEKYAHLDNKSGHFYGAVVTRDF